MEKYLAHVSDYRDREFRRSHLMSELNKAKDNLQLKQGQTNAYNVSVDCLNCEQT